MAALKEVNIHYLKPSISYQTQKIKSVKEASQTLAIMQSLKSEFHELFEDSKYLLSGTLKLIDSLKKAQPY